MSDSEHSVTIMLAKLKEGDEHAAQEIWDRFFDRVRGLAKKKLGNLPQRTADEEDIALSAINALYQGARDGRFKELEDRDDLWQILCMVTSRKAASAWRKKSARLEVGESVFDQPEAEHLMGIQHIADVQPDVAYLESLSQTSCELLEGLDERQQEIALLKLQGFKNQEIAEKIGRSVKTVERYLKSIREQWNP
ncbi:MAG: sigma-70 family RNA polymerase sigma factor [Planctomycetota bacterium]